MKKTNRSCDWCLHYEVCQEKHKFHPEEMPYFGKTTCDLFKHSKDYVSRAQYMDSLGKESFAVAKLYEFKRQIYQNPDDVVAVVRCKDCVYNKVPTKCSLWIGMCDGKHIFKAHEPDFYCSFGRREANDEDS